MKKEYAEIILKKTKENYNLTAEDFSRTRQTVWEELKFLFDYAENNDKILDLGCGNGRCLDFLKDKKIDYTGIDNSEELIKIARKKYPQINFQVADALKLPFPDNSFDKVYSIAVLHHIPSGELRVQFLKEAKRVLKPGGVLILTVWKFHRKKELFCLIKYTILKLIGKSELDFKDVFEPWQNKINRYYHWFLGREMIILVKKAGFILEKSRIIKNQKGNRRNIYVICKK